MERLPAVVYTPYAYTEDMVVFWMEKVPGKGPVRKGKKPIAQTQPNFCLIEEFIDDRTKARIRLSEQEQVVPIASLRQLHTVGRQEPSAYRLACYKWPTVPEWLIEAVMTERTMLGQKVTFRSLQQFQDLTGHSQSSAVGYLAKLYPDGAVAVAVTIVTKPGDPTIPALIKANLEDLASEGSEIWEEIEATWKVFSHLSGSQERTGK